MLSILSMKDTENIPENQFVGSVYISYKGETVISKCKNFSECF